MKNDKKIDKSTIFNDLFDNTYVGILVVDSNRNIILTNKRCYELFGYQEDELIGKNSSIFHLNNDEYLKFGEVAFKHVLDKKPMSVNFQVKKKDGTLFWAKISGDPIKHQEHILWTIVDITETYKIQEQLIEQSTLLKTVINETPYPIVLKNYNAKFVLVNEATAKLYKSNPDEMIGKDDGDYIPDKEMADFFRKNVQEIMNEGKTRIVYEDSIDVETNKVKHFMSIKKPFKNKDGENFILVLANDITELTNKNEELIKKEKLLFQQSKMAAMGEMISNIAHQWRQPLSMISTAATGAKLQNELGVLEKEELNNTLEKINLSTQHLSETIDGFRNYFQKDKKVINFNIEDAWNETINLIYMRIRNNSINIIKEIHTPNIKSFKNEFIQIFMNIINNSIDALSEIKEKRYLIIQSESTDNEIIIKIKDNAGGIDKDILEKIFDPYFTTKHQSQGTGIGLYMTEEIIVKHLNGEIFAQNIEFEIDNKLQKGVQFTIKLPIDKKL
ncbi:PAS domain S-box protein [Arcobacter sp. LA11]|uniref:PAS domain-containing sensor histidine kinase n=1 Tax=Arcobacter sp. LA11 TaxID=1898176 RepID=UPI00093420E1|nr:PAS domain S-box protein [Arcobacter sp. LA11]